MKKVNVIIESNVHTEYSGISYEFEFYEIPCIGDDVLFEMREPNKDSTKEYKEFYDDISNFKTDLFKVTARTFHPRDHSDEPRVDIFLVSHYE
ncbi:hypothetical protein [Croceivirga sp. JEA036]|uniref:hypothetical protein n=1 Tax=Croceivirga sp. JEA036 TaxID=2721162 RepID=UPI00143BC6DD|nr:hypothetical protein [Croceivirga sp. JEA036]NJB38132.1 hypothetical protein [Croceivirga sp. JEA036]